MKNWNEELLDKLYNEREINFNEQLWNILTKNKELRRKLYRGLWKSLFVRMKIAIDFRVRDCLGIDI